MVKKLIVQEDFKAFGREWKKGQIVEIVKETYLKHERVYFRETKKGDIEPFVTNKSIKYCKELNRHK